MKVWEKRDGGESSLRYRRSLCNPGCGCFLVGRLIKRALIHLPGGDLSVEWSEVIIMCT